MPANWSWNPVIWAIVGGGVVAGYFMAADKRATHAVERTGAFQARQSALAAKVAAGPTYKATDFPYGQFIEVTVPGLDAGIIPKTRTCFVWRDRISGSSSMACDVTEAAVLDLSEIAPETVGER